MSWVAYRHGGAAHVGVVDGEQYLPLRGIARIDTGTGLDALLTAEPDETQAVAACAVELLPPSWAPEKVFCVGLNYDEHIARNCFCAARQKCTQSFPSRSSSVPVGS